MNEYNGFKVGDLITAYHTGYHRLERIDQIPDRLGHPVVTFYYRMILTSNCNSVNYGELYHCHSSNCQKVDKDYLGMMLSDCMKKCQILEGLMN